MPAISARQLDRGHKGRVRNVYESRHQFHEDLNEIERCTREGIAFVVGQLDQALESLRNHDVTLAERVVAQDKALDKRYLDVHQGALTLLARQTPVAGDLRVVAALLHIIRCVERMGDQCANIAKLVPLAGDRPPTDTRTFTLIEQMGRLARHQVTRAAQAFTTRDLERAQDLSTQDAGIGKLNRDLFNRAVEIGEDLEVREWAMFMILVARALERIADNAVAIAEQTVFIMTGSLRKDVEPPDGR
jgi:phosphate transport system protein